MEEQNSVTVKCGPRSSILIIGRPNLAQFNTLCSELAKYGYNRIKEPIDGRASFQFVKDENERPSSKKKSSSKRDCTVMAGLLEKSRDGTLSARQIQAFSKLSRRARNAWDLLLVDPPKVVAEKMGIQIGTLQVYMYKVKMALVNAEKKEKGPVTSPRY